METLKRGLKSLKTFLHISDKETGIKPEKITILNRNDNNGLSNRRDNIKYFTRPQNNLESKSYSLF